MLFVIILSGNKSLGTALPKQGNEREERSTEQRNLDDLRKEPIGWPCRPHSGIGVTTFETCGQTLGGEFRSIPFIHLAVKFFSIMRSRTI
jgi:hypothetical protein